jgi:hypothetical protein
MEATKVYTIRAMTGCSCCHDENHERGFYRTKEDAERRINFYLTSSGKELYYPLASQFARRGRYSIEDYDVEILPDGRWIIEKHVIENPIFIDVALDGSATTEEKIYEFD